jgi:hypothetical protein
VAEALELYVRARDVVAVPARDRTPPGLALTKARKPLWWSASSPSVLLSVCMGRRFRLPECEHVRFDPGLEERDLQRPLADGVVLAHELVQPAVPEHAPSILVDIHSL